MPRILPTVLCLAFLGLARIEAQSRFAKVDGYKVRYMSFGTGDEAVVFIHGGLCNSTFRKMQAPVYQERPALVSAYREPGTRSSRMSTAASASATLSSATTVD